MKFVNHVISSKDVGQAIAPLAVKYYISLDGGDALIDAIGAAVEGLLAPAFAQPDGLFKALCDTGYRYDSSIAPARSIRGWYGGEYSIDEPVRTSALDKRFPADLVELPISVFPRLRLPISGAWLRLVGRWYCTTGIERLHARGITPMLYVHPWEFLDLPDVEGVPWRVYRRTGDWLRRAVKQLLERGYEFQTAAELADEAEVTE